MKPPTLHGEIHVKKLGFPEQVRYQWMRHRVHRTFVSFSLSDFTGGAASKNVKRPKHLIFFNVSFDAPVENPKYPFSKAVLFYTVEKTTACKQKRVASTTNVILLWPFLLSPDDKNDHDQVQLLILQHSIKTHIYSWLELSDWEQKRLQNPLDRFTKAWWLSQKQDSFCCSGLQW